MDVLILRNLDMGSEYVLTGMIYSLSGKWAGQRFPPDPPLGASNAPRQAGTSDEP